MLEFALFQERVVGFAFWAKTELVDLCPDSQNTLLPTASKLGATCNQGINRKKLEELALKWKSVNTLRLSQNHIFSATFGLTQ